MTDDVSKHPPRHHINAEVRAEFMKAWSEECDRRDAGDEAVNRHFQVDWLWEKIAQLNATIVILREEGRPR